MTATTYKNIVHLDFETFYDREYSLSKMPTISYVRDPRFEILGLSVALNDAPSVYMTEDEFMEWQTDIDWATTAVQAFNAAFDCLILTERLGIRPCYYLCSLSASRAMLPIDSYSLKKVAPLLGLGEKMSALVAGSRENTQALIDYANNDNELARGIFNTLYPMLPEDEKDLIHLTIKMAVEPLVCLDMPRLEAAMAQSIQTRQDAIEASGLSEQALTSNQQFAAALKAMGLTVPTKLSPTTGEETDALGKNDDEFVAFMAAYPEYAHIWAGRMAAKSNINIRRAERLMAIGQAGAGTMPMPTTYHGAKTGRWNGADKLNVLNFPSSRVSDIRKCLVAPKGHKIIVVDSSQIELRMVAWLTGHTDMMHTLFNNGDVYKREAANQFGVPEEEVTKEQRQLGKIITLASNYGMGATKFQKLLASGPMGMEPMIISDSEAYSIVTKYRLNNAPIPAYWKLMDEYIHIIATPGQSKKHGILTFADNMIALPSGRYIQYPGLQQDERGSWVYGVDKKVSYLWGGTVTENICQAVARDIIADHMLKIAARYDVVLSVHDEVVYLAKEEEAEEALTFGLDVFSKPPAWATGLVTKGEGDIADSYGDAK